MEKDISRILEEIAMLLEIKGENPFKSRAYYNAAKAISGIEDLDRVIKEKRLKEIKGIGDAISKKIEEYYQTGKMDYYEELKRDVPISLLELMEIPNLGPKKIKVLYDELGIKNAGELEYACRENRLVNLPGFGKKTQEKVLKGIEFIKRHKGEFLYADVYQEAEGIKERLEKVVPAGSCMICGSIRRRKEIVRDIDILVSSNDPNGANGITEYFLSLPWVAEVLVRGETKTSVRLSSGIEADLRVVKGNEFAPALMYFTGSKEHNVRLRAIAKKKGWKLNEYGLFEGENPMPLDTEEKIYNALGLSYIPPELREDMGEVEAAEKGELPQLVEISDIKGIFHIHTVFSDGSETIEKMAEAAYGMGIEYIGIADHSKSAYYAGGLKEEAIFRQWEEIDRLNRASKGIYIFKGIESDILPDGSLDYPDEVLKGFDFVIASIHSHFNLRREEQLKRVIRAMENPYTTMLGHPTGRLLLSREGYDIDMREVIDAAKIYDVVIELNASPYRLDIDWRHLKYAKEKGVLISINPDAHSAAGLKEIWFGVGVARKGWQEKKDILNTMGVNDIKDMFKRRMDGKGDR